MDCINTVNPWTLYVAEDSSSKKMCRSTINDRFPNYFRKSSSLVTCNICNVILLHNQTQQHFKIHHNKKFKKKFSKFKIPFNAVEGYDFICEMRRKKIISTNPKRKNKTNDFFKIKHIHSENNHTKPLAKPQSKAVKKLLNEVNSEDINKYMPPLVNNNICDRASIKTNEYTKPKNDEDKRPTRKPPTDRSIKPIITHRKRLLSKTSDPNNKNSKATDLKLNIRVNSEGMLTSSIKGEMMTTRSNIFDKMSNFCDNTVPNKPSVQSTTGSRGTIKQSGYHESYGCAIFSDEFNNSILIDNDKDDPEDFDCCESSLSNDSAYFSLPNVTGNPLTTPFSQCANLSDCSVAPPLVTAYQYSNSTNKVSYCGSGSQNKEHQKSTPLTMHVTRSLSYNSIVPPKSTVKHRFYVSGHSNQTIINTLRKRSSENMDINVSTDDNSDDKLTDFLTTGVLHSLSKASDDLCYFDCNKSFPYKNSNHKANPQSFIDGGRDSSDSRFWNFFDKSGLSVNVLIPKRLKWAPSRFRKKSTSQLNTLNSKVSPKNIIPKQQFNKATPHPPSDNPLLSSYTIDKNAITDVTKSDPMLTSEIMLDYQFPDRNQMSFQQRLLERGVISQRDIARSQRCLSFNVNSNSRKNNKSSNIKQNIGQYKRISTNKNLTNKSQVFCRASVTNPNRMNPIKLQKFQSTSEMSQDQKANTSLTKHETINHRRQVWYEDIHSNRTKNVSTLQGQCLSQNAKYINSDSPLQNQNNVLSSMTMDSYPTSVLCRPSSPNSSILHFNNSSFNPFLSAQNTFVNDQNRYSQHQIERKYINQPANNAKNQLKAPDNEFVDYHKSYDDYNRSVMMNNQSNYQTMYNPQMKLANHSTNIFTANFEL